MPLTSPRSVVVTLLTAIALVGSSATAVSAAPPVREAPTASAVPLGVALADDEPDGLPQMGDHDPADYADAAAELPAGLVDAIERDLDSTPEEYLAAADATQDAGAVVDALDDAGVDVLGSRIDGTELIVNVQDAAEAAVVESTGATAEIGAPEPVDFSDETFAPAAAITTGLARSVEVYGGQGYALTPDFDSGLQCSLAFPGYSISSGVQLALTAGHCLKDHDGWQAFQLVQDHPGLVSEPGVSIGAHIGTPLSGSAFFGSRYDSALLRIDSGDQEVPSVVTWNGGGGDPFATAPLPIWGKVVAQVGSPLCKSGSRTGWTCGTVEAVDESISYGSPEPTVNAIVSSICVRAGDSGGAAMIGNYATGIVSGSNAGAGGCDPSPLGVFFPLLSGTGKQSVATRYSDWEPAVTVQTPAVDAIPSTVTRFDRLTGTLDGATEGSSVILTIDGEFVGTADASDGTWSVPLATAALGINSYQVRAGWGVRSHSAGSATGSIDVVPANADRLDAPDSVELAALISSQTYGTDVDTVYVTGAGSWRSAAAVATAAAATDSPMLLVRSSITPAVATELTRLAPAHIVVVGSTTLVPSSLYIQLATYAPSITRWSQPSWPSLSRALVDRVFHTADMAFVVTYTRDDDSLAAASAAALEGAPLIFVDGTATTVPAATISRLQTLGVTDAYLVGPTSRVSNGIRNQIDAIPGVSVHRISGGNSYDMSRKVNATFASDFAGTAAYLAYGGGTSIGGVVAAAAAVAENAPVYLVPDYCVQVATIGVLASSGHTDLTLVGSTSELSDAVGAPTAC